MANHVNTFVQFHFIDEEAGKAKLQELYSRLEGFGEEGKYDLNLHEIFGIPETDELDEHGNATGPGTYSWNVENMGAKWAYLEDLEDDCFRITSAWSVPTDAINFIMEELAKADPEISADITAEDEFPNWVYAARAEPSGIYDWEEWQYDDIMQHMIEKYEEVAAGYDKETDDWMDGEKGDAARDAMEDLLWEEITEWQIMKLEEM